jgi:ABC-type nitrate/sulfonate/bicarbonate transport system permease component
MEWINHVYMTMRRILIAFAITMIIGTGLGLVMGVTDFWEDVLKNYVSIGITLPELLIAVFAAMWFGVSDITPIVTGSLIAFPFVTQIIYEGIKDIDENLVMMTRSFDVPRHQFLSRVVLRSIMPEWFSSARAGFAICWKLVTLAEFIAAENGLGFMIQYEMSRFSLEGVISWTLLFTIIILFVEYGIFRQLEKRVFAWREDVKGAVG